MLNVHACYPTYCIVLFVCIYAHGPLAYCIKIIDFCKSNGMRICNGRLGLDKGIGKYTYVGSTGSSVVDYVLISKNIVSTISKFSIDEPNILSDHCAVFFSLSNAIHCSQAHINDTPPGEKVSKKFIWNSEESQNYRNNINLYEEDFLLMQT